MRGSQPLAAMRCGNGHSYSLVYSGGREDSLKPCPDCEALAVRVGTNGRLPRGTAERAALSRVIREHGLEPQRTYRLVGGALRPVPR